MWDSKESITSIHEVAHRAFDSFCQELARNMYDKIKSRHTPNSSPIKCRQNVGYDDDDVEDEEEGEDDDEEEENTDEDDVEENNSQSRRYLLRKKKPVTNRYTAPPIKYKRGK